MGNGRPLTSYKEVRAFLENEVGIQKMILSKDIFNNDSVKNADFFSLPYEEIENIIIKKVYDANCDMAIKYKNNTYDSEDFRLVSISQSEREIFREEILENALKNEVLFEEQKIDRTHGGLLPKNEVQKKRLVFYLIGLPASGKSYLARKVSKKFGCITLDSDIIKRKIPEFDSRNGASLVHMESKKIIDEIRNYCIEKGCNLIEPIIGDDFHELADLIDFMKKNGYFPVVIHTQVETSISLYRATKRFIETGRYVPINKIIDKYGDLPLKTYKNVEKFLTDVPSISIDAGNDKAENDKLIRDFFKTIKVRDLVKEI